MCGIAGWIEKDSKMVERGERLKAISESLERRGPDENGIYINGDAAYYCLSFFRIRVIALLTAFSLKESLSAITEYL